MRTRARLYKRSHSLATRLPSLVAGAHSFVWLHLLSPGDLNDLTANSYRDKGRDAFGSETHNLNGLWPWEEAAFGQIFTGRRRILIAGAGGGREVVALAAAGHDVSAFDSSEELTRDCADNVRKAGATAKIAHAPPGEAPDWPRVNDALVVGRGVYHHIPGRDNRIEFLAACRRQVLDGSPLYLGDFLIRTDTGHRLTASSPARSVERGDSIGRSFFHYFTEDEIRSELDMAGFELLEFRVTPFPGRPRSLGHALARSRP